MLFLCTVYGGHPPTGLRGSDMVVSSATIDSLLKEGERYVPPASFRDHAWVKDDAVRKLAEKEGEGLWAEQAEQLHWFRKWTKVLEWEAPFARWFVGGKINVAYNCLDRHIDTPRRHKAAIVWEGEPGDVKVYTYDMLWREGNRFANALQDLGVKRGDRVTLYLPMIPELAIAMLACARIGAVHSVIFGGFSAKAVHDRIVDAESAVVVTADAGYRRGNLVHLKKAVDEAVADLPSVKHVVVFLRANLEVPMK